MTLREAIDRYVVLRQATGADFRATASVLGTFCRAVGETVDVADIPVARVHAFVNGTGPLTRYWHRKYSALRGFYRYAVGRHWVPQTPLPTTVPKLPPSIEPYIFTRAEMGRLLNATTHYRRPPLDIEPHTFRALLLLLYGAGVRVGEARRLTWGDVDLPGALLTIRETKFYKTRLVPLGADLTRALQHYADRRQIDGAPQHEATAFFVDRHGAPLRGRTLRYAFAQLRHCAGVVRRDGARYQPRLHDVRHTFVVRRLTTWYRDGADVQTLLPQLSTYLGHVNVAATQVYLTMTPDLLRAACVRFERYASMEDDDARYHHPTRPMDPPLLDGAPGARAQPRAQHPAQLPRYAGHAGAVRQ